mmetsp:Transcript_30966/g.42915  ORF Transcript_30966/g.42915 Transcript_30966/m.42915 type:complete len:168 (+) Transcript_30966:109-612(+)|eukprot:CAMPEP_0196582454 /NCGR_PEP_ID=MMETSP1081-20130531/38953_1 /TAXON_ID=36882 /ORGANISM="Pyramimonas amylifera, Strain CCMP720" /LENGTH=167 /DNA_ID=CAMNT_0041903013 /DNA_START=100 /DNA_END=603 /DNA_ORIENTATION=-
MGLRAGGSDATLNPLHISKRNRRNKGSEAVFDPKAHKDYTTGFHKRKVQRRKIAQKGLADKANQQRLESRRKIRADAKAELDTMREAHRKASAMLEDRQACEQIDGETDKEGPNNFEGVVDYSNGTQVVVQVIGEESDSGLEVPAKRDTPKRRRDEEKKPKKKQNVK